MFKFGALVFVVASLAAVPPAHANGRPPQTVDVFSKPGDDQIILVSSTFGLLISRDGGGMFQWVCENAVGYGGVFDPDYVMTTDGTFFAATNDALRVSHDQGCTWQAVTGELGAAWVDDIELGPNGEIWAVTVTTGKANDVYRSIDNGQTFVARNMRNDIAFWKSLRVAPSNGQRVYVTGYQVTDAAPDGGTSGPAPLMFRTDNGGDTWTPLDFAGIELAALPLLELLAVAPGNPDVVFARSVNGNGVGDIVYRSSDAGDSWTEVLRTTAPVRAFLIRKNGTILASRAPTGTSDAGPYVFESGNGGTSFTPATKQVQMACVTEQENGDLLACGANWEPDFFALARSTDGKEWTKLVRFAEIESAYKCPPATQQAQCDSDLWPALCLQFGCDEDTTPDAGLPPKKTTGGCCDAGASPAGSLALGALVGLLLVTVILRRRRARQATR